MGAPPRVTGFADDQKGFNDQRRLGFLLLPEFSMISVVSALEPLRGANRQLGFPAYGWTLYGTGAGPMIASNGMAIATAGGMPDLIRDLKYLDVLFVCAGLQTDPPERAGITAALVRAARAGVTLGSLSAGAFQLARAGLLDGYRCTVHWEFQPAFEEAFPEIDCTSGLYVIDRDRWTGSGGITGLDMMLHMIERDHGGELSRAVGNQFQVDRIRNAAIHQRPGQLDRIDSMPSVLQKAINVMMANIENPLKMEEIANLAGLNLRRMERLFKSQLAEAPAQFYRGLRLERARELLMHTELSTLEIGFLTGFSSSSHFAMAYTRKFGVRPTDTRRTSRRETQC